MYICNNCGALLESTVSIHEYHDELDDCSVEEYHGCPKYAAKASDFMLSDWIVETDDIMDLLKENI